MLRVLHLIQIPLHYFLNGIYVFCGIKPKHSPQIFPCSHVFSQTWGRNWHRFPTWMFKAATCSSTIFWVTGFLLMNQKDWFFITSISRVITRFPEVLNLIKELKSFYIQNTHWLRITFLLLFLYPRSKKYYYNFYSFWYF